METGNTDAKITTSTMKEDFVQQAGSFKLSVTRNGIVLSGPNGSVTVDARGVAVKGAIISLNGAGGRLLALGMPSARAVLLLQETRRYLREVG